jgi:hypothetical protein
MTKKTIALAVLLLAAPLAGADDGDLPAAVGVGDRVRARNVGGERITAEIVDIVPGALLVRTSPEAPPRRLDLSRLERLEVSQGRHGHATAGAVAGFVPGFLYGALIGAFFGCSEQPDCTPLVPGAIGGVIVGTVTGAFGALVGAAVRTERWLPLRLPGRSTLRLSPSVTPVRGGVGAGFTLRF